MTVLIPDGRRLLFAGLIDYAGLFPPAALDMGAAAAGYRAARSSEHAWIVGRFLCPASRLDELAQVLVATMSPGEEPWRLSVVFDGEPGRCFSAAQSFQSTMGPAASIELVETRVAPDARTEDIEALFVAAGAVAEWVAPFLEVPPTHDADETTDIVAAIASARAAAGSPGGAKLRCGGATAADFPDPRRVAAFIRACIRADLPFKATAGLHHPIRHHDPEIGVMRHGFLNLLAAAGLAGRDAPFDEVVAAVDETDPESFRVTFGGLRWRDYDIGTEVIATLRNKGLIAYGSCDFQEPVADLDAMGFLDR